MSLNMRCVHCRKPLKNKTKDHVFPKSWYPETTPPNVQRWTVPSCPDCNHKFGEMEKELFIRLAICIDPRKAEIAGISAKALRSLGVRAPGLTEAEMRHRQALKQKVLKDTAPYQAGTECFPGLGPHPGFPQDQFRQIKIPAELVREVSKKILRGCEYILGNGRVIEEPYVLEVYFVHDKDVGELRKLYDNLGSASLGPGFEVRRGAARDDPNTVLYKAVIWGTINVYGSIMPPE